MRRASAGAAHKRADPPKLSNTHPCKCAAGIIPCSNLPRTSTSSLRRALSRSAWASVTDRGAHRTGSSSDFFVHFFRPGARELRQILQIRRQHCRIVYRATRSRCESRDDAVFPAVPTRRRIALEQAIRHCNPASVASFRRRRPGPYERNAAISRHFERDPIPYALETDWPVGAEGFETSHHEFVSRWLRGPRNQIASRLSPSP